MVDYNKQIKDLQDELRKTKYNKATQGHIGIVKAKIAQLKEKQELIIETFPGIGPSLAKSLLKEFKTVKKIINASEKNLQKVEKLGPKKASEIKKVIEEEYI